MSALVDGQNPPKMGVYVHDLRSPRALRPLRAAARLRPGERRWLAGSVALALGATLAATALLTFSGYLISRAAQRPDILALTAVITAVRGFGLARALLRYGERLVSHELALRVLARLRVGFYALLAPLGVAALGDLRRGDLLARFVGDVDTLQDLYLRALAPPLVAALVIAAAGLGAWLILPVAGLVIAAALVAAAIVTPLLTALLAASAGRRQAAARAALTAELVESLGGAVELAVAGRGADRVARVRELGQRLTRIGRRDAIAGATATTLTSFMTGLTLVAVLAVAIPAVHGGELRGVMLAALVMLVLGATEGLAPLPIAARTLRGCAVAAGRLAALQERTPAVVDAARPSMAATGEAAAGGAGASGRGPSVPGASGRSANGSGVGALTVSDVHFRYPGASRELLRGVDLRLDPGCRVAITGPSGAGKTSLAELLVRFADPSSGRVALGGVDLRRLPLHEVRGRIVLARQDAHVFATTIRENVLLARREASDAELWSALAVVQLADFVRSLPAGLDTLVGEDGQTLSGGQRQRLTLARALVADADYLVLDEPTAQLDADTAETLMRTLNGAAGRRGLLAITHRPEGLERFEAVLELQDGVLERID